MVPGDGLFQEIPFPPRDVAHLGHLGLGDEAKARAFFSKAIEVEPLAAEPKLMLESIQ